MRWALGKRCRYDLIFSCLGVFRFPCRNFKSAFRAVYLRILVGCVSPRMNLYYAVEGVKNDVRCGNCTFMRCRGEFLLAYAILPSSPTNSRKAHSLSLTFDIASDTILKTTLKPSCPAQVASFLGALRGSGVMKRALVLCPATVLSHWMAELHTWAPQLRVVILHRCVQAFNAVFGSSGVAAHTCSYCAWQLTVAGIPLWLAAS